MRVSYAIISVMRKLFSGALAVVLIIGMFSVRVYAQSSSSNYSVEESAFSSGSGSGASASYSAQVSAGDLGIGSAYSTSYGAYAGPISPNEEYLEMVVTAASIDLDTPSAAAGLLSDTETAIGSGVFYVRAYINGSYSVVTMSQPPTNESGDTINPLAAATASSAGTEQFGINLVANTSPSIGANPVPQPNSTYANGQAASGYDTVNQFRYNVGDTIAQNGGSPAWGQTNFTVSYIANISSITESGYYTMPHDLIAVPTF